MKKILLIILLTVIGFTGRSLGQGTCTNATFLSPSDTIIQLSANDTVAWFMYQASTSYLDISLFSINLIDAQQEILSNAEIKVYSGSCGYLTEMIDADSLSKTNFNNQNLNISGTYYFRINYKGEWNPKIIITKYEDLILNTTCIYNCNLISNGDFSLAPIPVYANPFYYPLDRVHCWCAAWGTPMKSEFVPNTSNSNNSIYLGAGYDRINSSSSWYNGSEGIYQKINIEPNRNYNLNFKYKRMPSNDEEGGKIHVLITSFNFSSCAGTQHLPSYSPIPNINPNDIVWSDSFTIPSFNDLIFHNTYNNMNISIPGTIDITKEYKLLIYMQYEGTVGPPVYPQYEGISVVAAIDDVSLTPLEQTTVTITHSNTGTICPGDPVTLTGIVQTNYPYISSWSDGASYFNTINPITVNPLFTTTYTITVFDINGCMTIESYTIPVHQVPTPVINANFGNSICEGQTVTYTTQSGYSGYQWNISSGGTIIAGGTGNNYVTVVWNTPSNQTVSVNFISNMCPTSTTTYNLTVHTNPTVYAGDDREICKGDIISIGGNPTATGAPNITFNWFSIPATAINQTSSSNPTVAPVINTTFHVIATSSNGCNASDEVTVVVKDFHTPIITGHNNNCDLTTTYTATNGSNYSWSKTVNGTVTTLGTATTQTVTWPSIINNSDPCIVKVTNTENGCTSNSSITVYNCCKDELPDSRRVFHDEIINNSIIPPIAPEETVYLNGTIIIDNDNLTLNSNSFRMGPYAKIIVNEPFEFTITAPTGANFASTLEAGCQFMWDGVYVSDPAAKVEVTGNSTIRDAINGIVSDNGGIVTLNEANMTDNYYNVKITNTHNYLPIPGQPYPPYPGSVMNTNFNGSSSLALLPHIGHKTYMGIYCNNANNFTIGDDANSTLRNFFSNMRFGIYANNSDLYIYNNKFTNIVNGTYIPSVIQKYYPEGAIYAMHNNVKPYILSNTLKVGANITEPLKRNYFENCNTGIYSFQYVNTLNNNDFKDCYNGISLVNISSGTVIEENTIYGATASTVTFGKGISIRNAYPNTNGIACLIQNNDITNKQTGISLVNVKSTPENTTSVLNNAILNFVSVFPTSANVSSGAYIPVNSTQTGIMAEGCDGIQIKENTINHNYPVIAAEKEYIRGIRISESKNAYVFHNFMMHQGSGIFTNGLLTDTRFDCNILDHDYHGFYIGIFSLISDQGEQNVFNPHNNWQGNYIAGQEKLFSCPGCMINGTICNNPPYNGSVVPFAKWYYFDNSGLNYSPLPTATIGISYIVNNNATHYCQSGGGVNPLPDPSEPIETWEDREEAMGEIVRDERLYGYMEEYYRARDREYVYEILREDPSLLYMGTPDDNLYQQFYAEMHNSEAEQVLQLREAMYEEDLAVALSKLELIAGEDQINQNRRSVDGIYFNTWAQAYYDFTAEQESILQQIAYLTPYSGGDAVYTARVLLNIDPDDVGLDFVKPIAEQPMAIKENKAKVFPNPAREQITIQFDDIINSDAAIEIYGNMGNLILKETLQQGNYTKTIDVSKLKSGLYFYNISINGKKVTSGKITILNK